MDVSKLLGLDLFSGIGGISLALAPWVRTAAYCEIEPYARGVLLSRMASGDLEPAPIWDDVKTLDGTIFRGNIDIISGGFPCQDISCAGAGKGMEGERSWLFTEIVRLAEEIRPQFIFLENVPAIRTRGLGYVVRELARIRYDARWGLISAFDVGAPHKRERWFLLAYSKNNGIGRREQLKKFRKSEGNVAHTNSSRHLLSRPKLKAAGTSGARSDVADAKGRTMRDDIENVGEAVREINSFNDAGVASGTENMANSDRPQREGMCISSGVQSEHADPSSSSRRAVESRLGRVVDGLCDWLDESERGLPRVTQEKENRVDRLRCLGNSVCAPQVREAFQRLMFGGG